MESGSTDPGTTIPQLERLVRCHPRVAEEEEAVGRCHWHPPNSPYRGAPRCSQRPHGSGPPGTCKYRRHIANSLADLAWEHPHSACRTGEPHGIRCEGVSASRSAREEMSALRHDLVHEILGEIMEAIKAAMHDALSSFAPRLAEAKANVDALQRENEAQDREIGTLKERISALEFSMADHVENL